MPKGKNGKSEKPKEPKERSTAIELTKRIDAVINWILDGHDVSIIKQSAVGTWGISDRQAANYYSAAFKKIQENTKGDLGEKIAFQIAIRQKLYNGLKYKDTPQGAIAALRILESWAELEGVKPKGFGMGTGNPAGHAIHDQVIKTTLTIA